MMTSDPPIHTCKDFVGCGECCPNCHANGDIIVIYPESVFSVNYRDKMPDLSMGIRGEICCGLYDKAKRLGRPWWVRLYGQKHGYRPEHIEQLVEAANDPKRFLQVCGDIGSLYWRASHPDIAPTPRSVGRVSGIGTRRATISKCPSCGAGSFVEVCDNCGHGGGI